MKHLILLILLIPTIVFAESDIYAGVHLETSSFTNANNYAFIGTYGTEDISNHWSFKYLAEIKKDQYEDYEYKLAIKHAFLEYQTQLTPTNTIAIGIGRVRQSYGFSSRYAGVPSLHEYIYSPIGLYRDSFTDLFESSDGIGITYETLIHEWVGEVNLSYGKARVGHSEDLVAGHYMDPNVGSYVDSSTSGNFAVSLTSPAGNLKLYYSLTKVDLDFQSNLKPFVGDGTQETDLHSVGIRYYINEDWDITGEWMNTPSSGTLDEFKKIAVLNGFKDEFTAPEGYAITLRRTFDDFNIFFGYSNWEIEPNDPKGEYGSQFIGVPAVKFYGNSAYIGGCYVLNDGYKIKAQYEKGHGMATLNVDYDNKNSWEILAVQLIKDF